MSVKPSQVQLIQPIIGDISITIGGVMTQAVNRPDCMAPISHSQPISHRGLCYRHAAWKKRIWSLANAQSGMRTHTGSNPWEKRTKLKMYFGSDFVWKINGIFVNFISKWHLPERENDRRSAVARPEHLLAPGLRATDFAGPRRAPTQLEIIDIVYKKRKHDRTFCLKMSVARSG